MRIVTPLIAVILVVLLQPMTAVSQEQQYWVQSITVSYPSAPLMAKDAAANLYIETTTTAAGATFSFFLIKYNSSGTQQWKASYSNGNVTEVIGIGADNSQDLYVGINTKTGAAVMKYSPTGQLLSISPLMHNNGQPRLSAMKVDAAGNCYLTGYTITISPQTLTFKMNSAGVEQWVASYVGPGSAAEAGEAITIDPVGNVYVASSSGGGIATLKYDLNGNFLWAGKYTGPSSTQDNAIGIAVDTTSGNVYTVGQSEMGWTSDIGDVIGYSPSGIQLWAIQDSNSTANIEVLVDYAGNVITLGDPLGPRVFTATKYTSAGSVLWTNGYSPSQGVSGQVFAGLLDNSGNLYVTMPVGSSTQYYATVEYYSDGTLAWALTYTAAIGQDAPSAIALQNPVRRGVDYLQFPQIFVSGITTGTMGNSLNLTTIMYSQPPRVARSTTADTLTGNAASLTTPLFQLTNYPNPFRGATTIAYTIPHDSHVILQVYDGAGRPVATLVNEDQTSGTYALPFNTGRLAAGIYQYRITAQSPQGSFTQTKQMVIQ